MSTIKAGALVRVQNGQFKDRVGTVDHVWVCQSVSSFDVSGIMVEVRFPERQHTLESGVIVNVPLTCASVYAEWVTPL